MNKSRKHLSTTALIELVHNVFKKIKGETILGNRMDAISLSDCLMSGLAVFGLKYPSLLQFDKAHRLKETIKHNLHTLYKIKEIPSDTYLRVRLDEANPKVLRKAFKSIFAKAQRGKVLEQFKFMDDAYIVSVDGTGFFSSENIFCANCCIKQHAKGNKTYYHQMFCGAIVHPSMKTVIPFAPEPILKADGDTKNDCEYNALMRFIHDFRREHPHLRVIITADGLSSKGPIIQGLLNAKMSYILGAKPGDHKFLFEFVKDICESFETITREGKIQKFRYINQVPLNDSNNNVIVNFLELTEIDPKKRTKTTFSWVTNIKIDKNNIQLIAKGGRARWKIENETFNTLKNQNYNFEHNFGHGNKNLSTIFGMLMMLAFLIDQIQQLADSLFQNALLKQERKKYLWEYMRSLFFTFNLNSWEELWLGLTHKMKATFIIENTT